MASSDTTCPTDTWGSKNWASDAAITMSASATQWNAPPAQIPLTAVITGFEDALVPGREVDVPLLHRPPVALHAHAVGGDLPHVHPGLEGPTVAGVDDDPDLRVGLQLQPGDGQLVAHGEVHGVELVGPVEDQPADRDFRSTTSVV